MFSLPDSLPTVWVLWASLIFLGKHLLADFILQTGWMALGKDKPSGWLMPLSAHAAVHALLTTVIFVILLPAYWWLGLVDFVVHFTTDRLKGLASARIKAHPGHFAFWWLMGIDQTIHHITDLMFVLVIAIGRTGA